MSLVAKQRGGEQSVWLIVGLGNPGRQYEYTWHNCGYLALDRYAQRHGIAMHRVRFKGRYGEGRVGDSRVVLLKPETYMNLSGESVSQAMGWLKIGTERLIVLYDDFEIDRGQLRIRAQGGAGTHNGMKSIIQHVKSEDFARFRIGTGPVPREQDVISFVLGKISQSDRALMTEVFERCGDGLDYAVKENIELAMNRLNKRSERGNGTHGEAAEAVDD